MDYGEKCFFLILLQILFTVGFCIFYPKGYLHDSSFMLLFIFSLNSLLEGLTIRRMYKKRGEILQEDGPEF